MVIIDGEQFRGVFRENCRTTEYWVGSSYKHEGYYFDGTGYVGPKGGERLWFAFTT